MGSLKSVMAPAPPCLYHRSRHGVTRGCRPCGHEVADAGIRGVRRGAGRLTPVGRPMSRSLYDDSAPGGAGGGGARRDAASFAGSSGVGGTATESVGLYQLLVESVQDYAIFALDPDGFVLS